MVSHIFCYFLQQAQYLTDKAILGKMCGVYVTYAAEADKGQWHEVTLAWSFQQNYQKYYLVSKARGLCTENQHETTSAHARRAFNLDWDKKTNKRTTINGFYDFQPGIKE